MSGEESMSPNVRELRASAFTLVDEAGRARGGLKVKQGDPSMMLRDAEGRVRITASLIRGNPQLLLVDENGVPRVGVDCRFDGPSIFLRDRNGDLRLGLDFDDTTDTAVISLSEDGKHTRIELSANGQSKTSALNLYGNDKTVRVSVRKNEADGAMISLAEPPGRVTFLASDGTVFLSHGDSTRIIGTDREVTS